MAKRRDTSITIGGRADLRGVNVGGRDVIHTVASPGATVAVPSTDLREALRRGRDELVRLGGDRGPDIDALLADLRSELAKKEPDATVVRTRWAGITSLLTGAGAAAESIRKIAELVHSVFP
jgi:hypothetical protein